MKPIILKEGIGKIPKQKTPSGYANILKIFSENIIEVRFKRRVQIPLEKRTAGHGRKTRRMLCTSNWKLISSNITKNLFKWKKPIGIKRQVGWYRSKKLIIVWSLTDLDWRIVSLDDWEIIAYMPVKSLKNKANFISFFKGNIKKLSEERKNRFADK